MTRATERLHVLSGFPPGPQQILLADLRKRIGWRRWRFPKLYVIVFCLWLDDLVEHPVPRLWNLSEAGARFIQRSEGT